jgi:hypothetical protein
VTLTFTRVEGSAFSPQAMATALAYSLSKLARNTPENDLDANIFFPVPAV